MKHPPATLIDGFEAAASAAQSVENKYRTDAAAEIARLERERIVCFRRLRLVKLLAGASASAETVDAAVAHQRIAVADEFGWDADRADHTVVLDKLAGPGRAIYAALHEPAHSQHISAIADDLASFESWYQSHAGQPFYVLFDQYVPQAPLVDF